jgi:hypothetical protein
MVIKIVLFTLFFSIVSCQHQEKQTSSVEMKEGTDVDLAKLVLYPDDHVQYFISGQNDSVYITYGAYLHDLYSKVQDKYGLNYEEFVEQLLHGIIKTDLKDTVMDWYYYDTAFIVDATIWEEYKKEGINKLKREYCYAQEKKLFFKEISPETKRTIAYCFWLEGYKYIYGGILGEEYLKKTLELN